MGVCRPLDVPPLAWGTSYGGAANCTNLFRNRKGPEPPRKKRLRVVAGRECYLSSFALLGRVAT